MNRSQTTRYLGGHVYSPADPQATAVLVDGDRIAWLGADADAPTADVTVDLAGALVTPAFVDAHVHSTDTGIVHLGLDLAGTRSAAEVLDRVAAYAVGLPVDAVVVGHGWDESNWSEQVPPSPAELERASAGRSTYLSQASVHSAIVSGDLLARTPIATPGYHDSGWLRRDAHHVVRELAMGEISDAQREFAQRAALQRAASLGIAAVHECGGPGTSSEHDFRGVLALGREPGLPDVYGYWGELGGAERARALGAVGAGGDLYADGALGSQTAHLREPYLDAGDPTHAGHGYVTADEAGKHLIECTERGIQGGFHAIGDAAIGTVVAGFAMAAARLGVDRVRLARHRVEHAEILDKSLIAAFVEYGIVASVQPAFDRLWGGEHAMYAQRLGVGRSLASNPLGSLAGVGVALAFGSDSPVTPLDPWGTVRAAMMHHNPAQRLSARTAFAAHTRGGWRAVHADAEGTLAPGATATFALWATPAGLTKGLPTLVAAVPGEPQPAFPTCLRTVAHGHTIYDNDVD
ncbi:MAG TPA: amidohydrolase family protein [Micromonosporaceae bacterium]|nr:amidohydrolase family protein [Micromonosporaceae bacterium]